MKILITVFTVFLVFSNNTHLWAGEKQATFQRQLLQNAHEDSTQNVKLRQKSPKGALLRSLVFPGWGQWYNEQKIKSILVFSTESFLIGLSFYYNNKAADSAPGSQARAIYIDRRNLTYWVIAGFTLLSMLDAYIDAYLFDFDTGPDLAMRIGTLQNYQGGSMSGPVLGFSLRAKF